MFKFIKKLFNDIKNKKDRNDMMDEFYVILFLIEDSYSMEDFILTKKKMVRFKNRWDNRVEIDGSNVVNKLYRKYSRVLSNRRYNITLYAEKKKKKKEVYNKTKGTDLV